MWTDHQPAHCRKRGFLYQLAPLSQKQAEDLRTASEELVRQRRTLPEEVEVVRNKRGILRIVFCMQRRVEHFRGLCRSNEMGGPAKRTMGTDAYNIPNGVDNLRPD